MPRSRASSSSSSSAPSSSSSASASASPASSSASILPNASSRSVGGNVCELCEQLAQHYSQQQYGQLVHRKETLQLEEHIYFRIVDAVSTKRKAPRPVGHIAWQLQTAGGIGVAQHVYCKAFGMDAQLDHGHREFDRSHWQVLVFLQSHPAYGSTGCWEEPSVPIVWLGYRDFKEDGVYNGGDPFLYAPLMNSIHGGCFEDFTEQLDALEHRFRERSERPLSDRGQHEAGQAKHFAVQESVLSLSASAKQTLHSHEANEPPPVLPTLSFAMANPHPVERRGLRCGIAQVDGEAEYSDEMLWATRAAKRKRYLVQMGGIAATAWCQRASDGGWSEGSSLLHFATNHRIIEELLGRGSRLSQRSMNGFSAMQAACALPSRSPMQALALFRHRELAMHDVAACLGLDETDRVETPLHLACCIPIRENNIILRFTAKFWPASLSTPGTKLPIESSNTSCNKYHFEVIAPQAGLPGILVSHTSLYEPNYSWRHPTTGRLLTAQEIKDEVLVILDAARDVAGVGAESWPLHDCSAQELYHSCKETSRKPVNGVDSSTSSTEHADNVAPDSTVKTLLDLQHPRRGVTANVNACHSYRIKLGGDPEDGPIGSQLGLPHEQNHLVEGESPLHVACEYGFEQAALSLLECGASSDAKKVVSTWVSRGGTWVTEHVSYTPDDPEGWLRALPATKALRARRARCQQLLSYSRQRANSTSEQLAMVNNAKAVAARSCQGDSNDGQIDGVAHYAMIQSIEAAQYVPHGVTLKTAQLCAGMKRLEMTVVKAQSIWRMHYCSPQYRWAKQVAGLLFYAHLKKQVPPRGYQSPLVPRPEKFGSSIKLFAQKSEHFDSVGHPCIGHRVLQNEIVDGQAKILSGSRTLRSYHGHSAPESHFFGYEHDEWDMEECPQCVEETEMRSLRCAQCALCYQLFQNWIVPGPNGRNWRTLLNYDLQRWLTWSSSTQEVKLLDPKRRDWFKSQAEEFCRAILVDRRPHASRANAGIVPTEATAVAQRASSSGHKYKHFVLGEDERYKVVRPSGVDVRTDWRLDSEIVGRLFANDRIKVLEARIVWPAVRHTANEGDTDQQSQPSKGVPMLRFEGSSGNENVCGWVPVKEDAEPMLKRLKKRMK